VAHVELHSGAEADLEDAATYYDGQRPGLATRYRAEWERCLELIASAPERWPVIPEIGPPRPQVRRLVMRVFPYVVPYVIRGDTVLVVAVAHTSRSPSYWLPRLK